MTYLFLVLISSFIWPIENNQIHLGIGESHRVSTKPMESVRIQKKGILQMKDEGAQLVFIGKKLGKTQVTVGKKTIEFSVIHKKHRDSLEQLTRWVKEKRGPRIIVVNGEPVVVGRLLRLRDFSELLLETNDRSQFTLQLNAELELQREIQLYIDKIMNENNLTPGRLSFLPSWEYLIPPHEKANLSVYRNILAPLGVKSRIDSQSLSEKPVIKIQVYIAHVKKSFMRNFGIRWPGELNANLVPGTQPNWEGFNISLKALEDQGQGKMLATPTLITESENPAEFHSGGEFPIRSTTQFNNNVEWKQYGLFLKTTPIANSRKNLKIKIDLELSSLDQTSNQTDIPALTRSHVKTQINMDTPRPILISGFLQQQSGNNRSGLPWLQQIPILNPLFSSGQIYNNDFELIFVLVPSFHDE